MSSKEIDTMIPMNYSSFLILLSLREKSYGYKIMKYVEDVTEGIITIGPATMYRTLSDFLSQGYIDQTLGENNRKEYILTKEGQLLLEKQKAFINLLHKIQN